MSVVDSSHPRRARWVIELAPVPFGGMSMMLCRLASSINTPVMMPAVPLGDAAHTLVV